MIGLTLCLIGLILCVVGIWATKKQKSWSIALMFPAMLLSIVGMSLIGVV
jgi:hypothetical protein